MQRRVLAHAITLTSTILLGACATPAGPTATARLEPTQGNTTSGTVSFTQAGDKVLVRGAIRGLKPYLQHGFHVHEKGDCSSGDGMSTGGHFNPAATPHGQHGAAPHHAGDLPSLKGGPDGVVYVDFQTDAISVGTGKPNDVVGRGLIVHRDPDDYKTQPTGNSGPRLACAVIVRNR